MPDTNVIRTNERTPRRMLLYAAWPIPFYAYALCMAIWNIAHTEPTYEWDYLVGLLAMGFAFVCSLCLQVYFALAIRKGSLSASCSFWKFARVHLKIMAGPFLIAAFPVLNFLNVVLLSPGHIESMADVTGSYGMTIFYAIILLAINLLMTLGSIAVGRYLVTKALTDIKRIATA